ncbi:protein kilB [Kitasatospora sp. NPDC059646]|uniref:protein kilB n=1 Tax=Kitasatospora sp. NPDC059646 TaxID=3346893 RepID=UPI00367802AB
MTDTTKPVTTAGPPRADLAPGQPRPQRLRLAVGPRRPAGRRLLMAAELALALVGVGGTIAATLTTALLQHRAARASRADTAAQEQRRELIAAVTALMAALAAHRRAMYARERLRLAGAPEDVVAEARSESHRTRAEITAPVVTLAILAPPLADLATDAEHTTYAMRGAADQAALDKTRTAATTAASALVTAAAAYLA